MKKLFDDLSYKSSKLVTNTYSTSFALAVGMLAPSIRKDIHSIYGFVRFADEIVDTFHQYNKPLLLEKFRRDTFEAIREGIAERGVRCPAAVNRSRVGRNRIETECSGVRRVRDRAGAAAVPHPPGNRCACLS